MEEIDTSVLFKQRAKRCKNVSLYEILIAYNVILTI